MPSEQRTQVSSACDIQQVREEAGVPARQQRVVVGGVGQVFGPAGPPADVWTGAGGAG
jgi:hypothetical protein